MIGSEEDPKDGKAALTPDDRVSPNAPAYFGPGAIAWISSQRSFPRSSTRDGRISEGARLRSSLILVFFWCWLNGFGERARLAGQVLVGADERRVLGRKECKLF